MRLLIVGGTTFLGPHLIDAARGRGHDVTIFHRGSKPFAVPAGVRELLGDRTTADAARLREETFDAVIDTCGYRAEALAPSLEALSAVRRYVFVSSISVYADFSKPGLNESAPLHDPAQADSQDAALAYGAGKVGCERAVLAAFGGRATLARPGLIAGPFDPTDRFTYWVERLARGGEILAPGSPRNVAQCIDVRDLSAWLVLQAETGAGGSYNVTGRETRMDDLLAAGVEAIASAQPRSLTWVDSRLLSTHGVQPWTELPLWLSDDPKLAGFMRVDVSRALAAGLSLREHRQTFVDTHAWAAALPAGRPRRAGLDADKERMLLSAAHRAHGQAHR